MHMYGILYMLQSLIQSQIVMDDRAGSMIVSMSV